MAEKTGKNTDASVSKLTHIKMFGQNRTQNAGQPAPTQQFQPQFQPKFENQFENQMPQQTAQQMERMEQQMEQVEPAQTAHAAESRKPEATAIAEKELPSFLQNIHQTADLQPEYDLQEFKSKENRVLDFDYLGSSDKETNPNSFSSIFNKDHAEQTGVQRVFRKSMALLVAHTILFAALILAGINFFQLNLLITLGLAAAFVIITNIFYIILADKSYVWLSLATQGTSLLLINSFIGQGFSIPTLLFITVTLLLSYIAYTEIEKYQLGARLFKISIVTNESTRLLTNMVALVLALSVFNSIAAYGSQRFFDETVLKSEVANTFIFKGVSGYGLNNALISFNADFQLTPEKFKFYDFLEENYRGGEELVLKTDENTVAECVGGAAATKNICTEKLKQIRYERAQKWASERYPKITFPVETQLNAERYNEVVKEHYSEMAAGFITENNTSTQKIPIPIPSFVPRNLLVPAVAAIAVYILLFIVGFVLKWLIYFGTVIAWKALEIANFVNIDVENVEAEVVSI